MAARLQGVSAKHLGSIPGHGLWGHLVFSAALQLPSQGPSLLDQPPGQAAAGAESEGQADPRWKEKAWRLTACPACLLRIFIIWAISSWFRRGPAPQDQAGPGGAPRVASRNLFPKDTLMVTTGWEARPGRGGGEGVGEWHGLLGQTRSLVTVRSVNGSRIERLQVHLQPMKSESLR